MSEQSTLTPFQKMIVRKLAEKNMNASEVARGLNFSRFALERDLRDIREATGLDPQNFFDLHELYQMATGDVFE